jgi:hypothetical protein
MSGHLGQLHVAAGYPVGVWRASGCISGISPPRQVENGGSWPKDCMVLPMLCRVSMRLVKGIIDSG